MIRMRVQHLKWTAALLIASVCSAQTAVVAAPSVQPQTTALTVPAGTVVPLTLDRQILRKGKIGDSVNATVAFPVTIGNQVAIPAGTDVLGVITAISTKDKTTHLPSVAIHFTRMTYPDGYIVIFDAVNTAALTLPGEPSPSPSPDTYADASFGQPRAFGPNPAADPQQQPNPVQDPYHGKLTPGEKTTILILGPLAFFGTLFALLFWGRKSAQSPILFDSGWQFQMTTQNAFVIDTTKVIGKAAAH
jgi:hypothetical protein